MGCFRRARRQEIRGHLNEAEQLNEQAEGWKCPSCGGDGARSGCIWCGMPCPEGQHTWDTAEMIGEGQIHCTVCHADGWRIPPKGKRPERIEF